MFEGYDPDRIGLEPAGTVYIYIVIAVNRADGADDDLILSREIKARTSAEAWTLFITQFEVDEQKLMAHEYTYGPYLNR